MPRVSAGYQRREKFHALPIFVQSFYPCLISRKTRFALPLYALALREFGARFRFGCSGTRNIKVQFCKYAYYNNDKTMEGDYKLLGTYEARIFNACVQTVGSFEPFFKQNRSMLGISLFASKYATGSCSSCRFSQTSTIPSSKPKIVQSSVARYWSSWVYHEAYPRIPKV